MSVYRRGSRWYVHVKVHGRSTRRVAGDTWAEAKKLEGKLRAALRVPTHGLEDALQRLLEGPALTLRSRPELLSVARAVRPFIAGKTLDEAPAVAERMVAAWSKQQLAVATINRRLALLRRLCNLAFQWGWTDAPIGRRVKLLPGEVERHVYLTEREVRALAKACGHPGAAAAVMLAAYTGLRRGELLRLTKASYRGGWLVLDGRTKSGRPRAVPVVDQVKAIAVRLPLPVTDDILRRSFQEARCAIGRPELHFHDLRHTCASLLVQAGIPLRTVGEILGHSTPAMTARYAHLTPKHLQEAMRATFGGKSGSHPGTQRRRPRRETRANG